MLHAAPVYRLGFNGTSLLGRLYAAPRQAYTLTDEDAEFRMRRDPLFELHDEADKIINLARGMHYQCPHCGSVSSASDIKRTGDMDSVMCPLCRTYCLVQDWTPAN